MVKYTSDGKVVVEKKAKKKTTRKSTRKITPEVKESKIRLFRKEGSTELIGMIGAVAFVAFALIISIPNM